MEHKICVKGPFIGSIFSSQQERLDNKKKIRGFGVMG